MRVVIADDEPLARERLALLVRGANQDAEIVEATNGADALALLKSFTPDVLFLDVQMPSLDGFEVLQSLEPARWPTTVFVTAFDAYALRAFEVSAVDYLLKPFDDERFLATWQRVGERRAMRAVVHETEKFAELLTQLRGGTTGASAVFANGNGGAAYAAANLSGVRADANGQRRYTDRVLIKHEGRSFMVRLTDVQWIESAGNYIVLHAGKGKHQLRETLTNLEARLDPAHFVRIHRRMIVGVDAMRELQAWFGGDQIMILKDGTRLRVSRNFREHVADRLSGVS
ncbi:MAG: response regulator transcription factor [Phycisphaerae bacterium]|nr:response regulator transcription factor [Gemmatimonadaceae bacterium]